MSGPKRGYYYIPYDPTPTRLADLERFSRRLDDWLERNARSVRQYLGAEALAEAETARARVAEFLHEGDPDQGFDAYGEAWATFKRLQSDVAAARKLAKALEQRRRQEQRQRAIEEAEAAAATAVAECQSLLKDQENRELLSRWVTTEKRRALEASLRSLEAAEAKRVPQMAAAWREQSQKLLERARKASAENTRRLAELMPQVQEDLAALATLNMAVLPDDSRVRMSEQRQQLAEALDDAMAGEDAAAVAILHGRVGAFVDSSRGAIQEGEARLVGRKFREALVKLGLVVQERSDGSGGLVLEAKGFPTRSVRVMLGHGSEEVRLHMDPAHDKKGCATDLAALQRMLAADGIVFQPTETNGADLGTQLLIGRARGEVRNR